MFIHTQGYIQVLWQLFWRDASETLKSFKGTPHMTKHNGTLLVYRTYKVDGLYVDVVDELMCADIEIWAL